MPAGATIDAVAALRLGAAAAVASAAAPAAARTAAVVAITAAWLFTGLRHAPRRHSLSLSLFLFIVCGAAAAAAAALVPAGARPPVSALLLGAAVAALPTLLGPRRTRAPSAGPFGPLEVRAKRIFDLTLAVPAALIVALLLVAIRLHQDRVWIAGFFYRQVRTGFRGRLLLLTKIRTMSSDAESDGRPRWSERAAGSVSSTGKWLRRLWLDELPQIFDVLRGALSLVGPRPERPEFIEGLAQRLPKYARRLSVPPGITGLAQVLGFAGDTSIRKRLVCDLLYARRWSPWMDLRLLARTAGAAFLGRRGGVRGANRQGEPRV